MFNMTDMFNVAWQPFTEEDWMRFCGAGDDAFIATVGDTTWVRSEEEGETLVSVFDSDDQPIQQCIVKEV